jgi:hypothetical protein
MRKTRRRLVIAVGLTLALGVAGVAYAANTTSSTATINVTPSLLKATKFKAATLAVHTHSRNIADPNKIPASAQNVDLDFDNALKFTTKGLATCKVVQTNAGGPLDNTTTAQAKNKCGTASQVGAGSAQASNNNPAPGQPPVTHTGVVTAFNGKKDSAGHPTIYLHTRFGADLGNVTVVLVGVLVPSPVGGDYGKRLQVHNIPQVPGVPLTDFQTTVKKDFKVDGVTKHYISAKCNDADHRINMRTTFDYSNAGEDTDVVNAFKACTVG